MISVTQWTCETRWRHGSWRQSDITDIIVIIAYLLIQLSLTKKNSIEFRKDWLVSAVRWRCDWSLWRCSSSSWPAVHGFNRRPSAKVSGSKVIFSVIVSLVFFSLSVHLISVAKLSMKLTSLHSYLFLFI